MYYNKDYITIGSQAHRHTCHTHTNINNVTLFLNFIFITLHINNNNTTSKLLSRVKCPLSAVEKQRNYKLINCFISVAFCTHKCYDVFSDKGNTTTTTTTTTGLRKLLK